jgi:hypothetical protein
MVGCDGVTTFPNRAVLCSAGWTVCTADQWIAERNGAEAPTHNYWTNDNLRYGGTSSNACWASVINGTACPQGRPMHVCGAAFDVLGNSCGWTGCGYETVSPNQHFGGCAEDATAGALCCDPSIFGNGFE